MIKSLNKNVDFSLALCYTFCRLFCKGVVYMKELLKAVDDLPFIAKLILCIPALDIVWAIYRIIKGVVEKNTVLLVVGIIWIIGAFSLGWLVDLITVALNKERPILT